MERVTCFDGVGRRCPSLVAAFVAAVVTTGCETSSTLTVSPNPVKCQVSLAAPSSMVDAGGGTGTLAVTTQPECPWEATTTVNWISGLSPASGQGTGNLEFRVAPNEGASSREGAIVVNDNQVRVAQRAPCRFDLGPASQSVSAGGGAGSVNVSVLSECAWTATTDVSWISLTPPLTGNGNGTVAFTVAPNGGDQRTGSVIIGGQRSVVTQAAPVASPCDYRIAPTSQNIGATGGAGTVAVSAQGGCAWTASSTAAWITVTAGSTGRGNGSVAFSVAANTGASRTGTLTIAGETFIVTQAASGAPPAPSCTYSISPGNRNVDANARTDNVNVLAGSGCMWTAVSNASWIAVMSGSTGTGNGSVGYSLQANIGASRTGTLTIAGQTFTVTQAAATPCSYSISPHSKNSDANARTDNVSVSAGSGCTWTAVSNASWITVMSGSTGTGNGSVGYGLQANIGASRTGTLTIAGETFTVTQAAAPPCSYSISPDKQKVDATPGTGTVAVSTASHCTWTATSNATWITITSGASGTGNGTVTFRVGNNNGEKRKGTLTVAGRTAEVEQEDR